MAESTAGAEIKLARQKKWATKVRSGCLTCRARRVKCDETRPACQQCIRSKKQCKGYTVAPALHSVVNLVSATDTVASRRQPSSVRWDDCDLAINWEAEPPEWDYMQSIRYYLETRSPDDGSEFSVCTAPPFNRSDWIHETFVCMMVCEQIEKLTKNRLTRLKPAEDFTLRGLWTVYYRSVLKHIKVLNMCLRDEGHWGGKNRVFYCIARLMYFDLKVSDLTCQSHINGYFAYVQKRGGVRSVLSLPLPPVHSFQAVLTVGAAANTTSPPDQQIAGPNQLSDDEIRLVYDWAFLGAFPCPNELFVHMIQLTRLRVQVSSGQITGVALAAKVDELFRQISTVNLDAWIRDASARSNNASDGAAAFRAATLLYGILSLPSRAVAAWAAAAWHHGSGGLGAYESVRSAQQQALLDVLRRMAPKVKCRCCISWPLLVAGVAAADGAVDGARDFVEESLLGIAAEPEGPMFALPSLQKFRELWSSGKTGWDDCFTEPFIAIQ